jgi:endonuclease/exonuclease/phosphatase family metal-dependent hydrolase
MTSAASRSRRVWEEVMAGELHEISAAIGALQAGQEALLREQQNFLTMLNEKDARDQKSHAETQRKVDVMYKAYQMGTGIFWVMTFGGVVLGVVMGIVELVAKVRALFPH